MIDKPQRQPVVISDDLPEAYVRRLYAHRLDRDALVFSRGDALQRAERERRRNPKQQLHSRARAARGRAVRDGDL